MLRAPSTTALICLEASARLRSFTNAANELHLTQGAVSRQILALEDRLGVKLFVRRRDALVLTEAGRYYLAEINPFLLMNFKRKFSNASFEAMEKDMTSCSMDLIFCSIRI